MALTEKTVNATPYDLLKIVYFAIMKFERSVKTTDSNYLFTETAFEYTLVTVLYVYFFVLEL